MLSGRSKKIRKGWNLMEHISSWFMLMMIILLGENTKIIKENREALLEVSREVGLEVHTEKTKYMVMSCT
jgi:predicted amino acid-binding ACT domain protein